MLKKVTMNQKLFLSQLFKILTTILWRWYFRHPHVIDEETFPGSQIVIQRPQPHRLSRLWTYSIISPCLGLLLFLRASFPSSLQKAVIPVSLSFKAAFFYGRKVFSFSTTDSEKREAIFWLQNLGDSSQMVAELFPRPQPGCAPSLAHSRTLWAPRGHPGGDSSS